MTPTRPSTGIGCGGVCAAWSLCSAKSCRRRQQQRRRADKLQSTADDAKAVWKAPAREVGLYRTSPYNINDAGNDEYYSQAGVRIVGVSEVSFAIIDVPVSAYANCPPSHTPNTVSSRISSIN
jgi:hypothetical protein